MATFASPVISGPLLDIDGNGQADALTDGLLIIRYLFGLRGPSLTAGAVGPGATTNDIEGQIQNLTTDGIFVAADGSNANPGTKASPVRNIGTGLAKAIAAGKHTLYISDGNYGETVTLGPSNQGIALRGGYRRSSEWLRDGTRGVVTGARTGALRVDNVTAPTVVEYLRFFGTSAIIPGTSSHAVVVTNSTGFQPRFLTVTAGSGATGQPGAHAGATGGNGGDGTVGANGYEDDSYIFCAGNQIDPSLVYAGGDSCVGAITSTRGGDGRRGCITNGAPCAGTSGDPGSPNPAGPPGDPGIGAGGAAGGSGLPGQDGFAGAAGGAGSGGFINGAEWLPNNGGSGGPGGDGSGGGGAGGWSVGVYRSNSTWSDGGTTTATLGAFGLGGASPGNPGINGSVFTIY